MLSTFNMGIGFVAFIRRVDLRNIPPVWKVIGEVTKIKGVELFGKYFHIGTVDAIKMTEDTL
jgi:hypothetical protein